MRSDRRIRCAIPGVIALALLVSCAQRTAAPTDTMTSTTTSQAQSNEPRIVFPDHFAVTVEIASDEETRQQGLMYRDRLPDDRGMIFLFPETSNYPFWMKNTLIPLDMIWIDDQKHIAHVAHDVPPCKADPCPNFDPQAKARYVLEVAAGVAARHHLADGDALRFEGLDKVIVR